MSFLTCNILMIHSLVGKTIMLRNNPQSVLNFSMTKMSGASDSSVECRLACSLHLPVAVVPEDQTVDQTILVLASSPCLKRIPPFRGGGGGRSSSSSSEGEIFSLSLFSFFCRGDLHHRWGDEEDPLCPVFLQGNLPLHRHPTSQKEEDGEEDYLPLSGVF